MPLSFTGRAPFLQFRDPLGELLGSLAPGEVLRFDYDDAVRHAGHSCATVAGAYLMTVAALRALYGEEPAVRGEIEVTIGAPAADPVMGPMSQVIGHLTGAAGPSGFAGLHGQLARRNLLRFDAALNRAVRFRRTDENTAVEVRYSPAAVPPSPEVAALVERVLLAPLGSSKDAIANDRRRLAELWQARVEAIVTGELARFVEVRSA